MSLFHVKNIEKNFDGVQALRCGELEIEEGKIVGLLGANGSGKSTISKIICGIYTPCCGEMLYNGEPVTICNPEDARRMGIVMIHQHLSLINELTVWENIFLGREATRRFGFFDKAKNKKEASRILSKLTDTIDPEEKVANLSPSGKQIVEIAKALSQNPKILILDEPTAALEQSQVKALFEILLKLKNDMNVSMVFISHRMWEVVKICDKITVFRNGETVGHVNLEEEEFDENKVVSMITGKSTAGSHRSEERKISDEVRLTVENLSVDGCLDDVGFHLRKGEILGIAGLSGQGQEELLLALAGFIKKDSGRFSVDGKYVRIKNTRQAIGSGIMLVPGDRHEEGAFLEHSVSDNVAYPYYGAKKSKFIVNKKAVDRITAEAITTMNVIPPRPEVVLKKLSGGNQQKVVVGKWLNLNPKVFLLSDPAKGVDVDAKEEMYAVVRRLSERDTSVILYASDNEELINVCDRVLVMFEGKIVANLEKEQVTDEQIVERSLGLSSCENQKSKRGMDYEMA